MLGELFHYFKKYDQKIAHEHDCKFTTLEFHGDLSGSLLGWDHINRLEEVIIFSFIDIKDAIKKFRKEIDSWQG